MSQIAILSDIHANLAALEAVLREAKAAGIVDFAVLGDTVDHGGEARACLELIRNLKCPCVNGNMEVDALNWWRSRKNRPAATGATRRQTGFLDEEHFEWLAHQPYTQDIPGATVAHACLHDPEAFDYMTDNISAQPTLRKLGQRLNRTGFFGHTHLQKVFASVPEKIEWLDDRRLRVPSDTPCAITVGSVGKSRHHRSRRAACWVAWNPVERVVEFRHTEF